DPDVGDGVDLGALAFGIADARLEAQTMALADRVEVQNDLEARSALRIVDAAEIDRHVERHGRVVAEEAADFLPSTRLDHRGVGAEVGVGLDDRVAELRLERFERANAHDSLLLLSLLSSLPSRFVRSCTSPASGSSRGFTMPGRRSPVAFIVILSWR